MLDKWGSELPMFFCPNKKYILRYRMPFSLNSEFLGKKAKHGVTLAKILCKPHLEKSYLVKGHCEMEKSKSASIGLYSKS